jgi:hypothetical protein
MAKSRSESLLREAFPLLSLRGAEGDRAQRLARAEAKYEIPSTEY